MSMLRVSAVMLGNYVIVKSNGTAPTKVLRSI
jgi:hypothetical protein